MLIKEIEGATLVLQMAHPPSNTLSLGLLTTLAKELSAAARDPSVKAVVLASAYPRYFSVGLDLQEMVSLPSERRGEHLRVLLGAHRVLRELPKPTVAAIGGSAILGGWILALGCDYRLLSAGTGKIALSEIRIGMSPTSVLVSRMLEIAASPAYVKEMVLRGKTLRAEEALAAGLVDALIPAESLKTEALALAKSLSRQPPLAYAAVKRALSRRPAGDEEALWREGLSEFENLFAGPEAAEGIAAMIEKRRPRWDGGGEE